MTGPMANTDREIWRELPDDFYSPSIHVTEHGDIGINVGGHVIVAPVKIWHDLGEKHLCVDPKQFGPTRIPVHEPIKCEHGWFLVGACGACMDARVKRLEELVNSLNAFNAPNKNAPGVVVCPPMKTIREKIK